MSLEILWVVQNQSLVNVVFVFSLIKGKHLTIRFIYRFNWLDDDIAT
ncbi:hypothetical protein PROSTU_01226 [Providencia stuartii ATCC 25827]|uniref:Uncharacterized protein n=1 Tax=Providencia stuartii ATCC 25827 TaxID=471874 RepID=A0AA87CSB5_PROST|nr:hypothetical protein PROSTU_01226 [Providencia stuartii ATCC 25827]